MRNSDGQVEVLAESAPRGYGLALSIGVVAVLLGAAAISIAYLGAGAPVASLSSQISSQQSEISSLQSQVSALPSSIHIPGQVNQPPQNRTIFIEWEATLPTLQDRWFPQVIVANQGDTLNLIVESNDTDGAHTFTINTPTGTGGALQETQLNMSWVGQWKYFPPQEAGPQFGTKITGPDTGCMTMGQSVPCNTVGGCSINGGPIGPCTGSFLLMPNQTEIASIEAHVTIGPLLMPGVYRYFCFYHQAIGMEGYLVVLPNQAFKAP
jgi:hypothetical protein